MRALRLTAWQHDPELLEVDEPEPGPGGVVVRIGGAGACHSDLHFLHEFPDGLLPFDPPFTLGHENAGWVESVGADVTGLEVGTTGRGLRRVGLRPLQPLPAGHGELLREPGRVHA